MSAWKSETLVQISTLGFPKADPEAPLVQLGIGSVDMSKPVIMCIGHNVIPSVGIIDYAKDHKVDDKIEVVGLCCTAFDITRYYNRGKIVGPISWQLRFIRGGFADVVVLDEQCVRTDAFDEAQKSSRSSHCRIRKELHGLQEPHKRPSRRNRC